MKLFATLASGFLSLPSPDRLMSVKSMNKGNDDDATYIFGKTYASATDCSGQVRENGLQINSCLTVNKTRSISILCPSSTTCEEHIYDTGDCTGDDAYKPIEITTDGTCHKIESPMDSKDVVYGSFVQSNLKNVLSSLPKPYVGMWENDATCNGPAIQYFASNCNSFSGRSSKIQCTSDGVPQSCYWQNSTTCGDKGTVKGICSPMTGSENCKSIKYTNIAQKLMC